MCRIIKTIFLILANLAVLTVSTKAATNRITFNNQDLFLNGGNFAWRNFANDFGPNSVTDFNYFNSVFSQVRAKGGNCMRLWLHTHGGNTPTWSGNTVTGPGSGTICDIKGILDRAWTNKMGVILCLWSFDMLKASYNTSFPGLTTRCSALLTNDASRGSYITNALIPMVDSLKDHPAIVAWEIFNEPEGMTTQFGWTETKVDISYIQKFVNQCAGAIHRTDPNAKVSNGAWSFLSTTDVTINGSSAPNNRNYYRDDRLIGAGGDPDGILDFYMVHYYDWAGTKRSPFHNDASTWGLTKPLVVAEFFPDSSNGCTNCGTGAYTNLYNRGYTGALAWSWTDSSTNASLNQIAAVSNAHPADVLIIITSNPPPAITLTAPTNSAVFPTGSVITLTANASDSGGGTVTNVKFYQGNSLLGQDNTSPYQFAWTNPSDANYLLTAVATDNGGLSSTSSIVNITVGNPPPQTRYEAEDAILTADLSVVNDATASAGKYVYMQNSGTILWTISNIPIAGTYQLTIGYNLPFSSKNQYLQINGGNQTELTFDGSINTWLTKTVSISLNAGANQLSIEKSWGYTYYDFVELVLLSSNTPPVFAATPANRTITEFTTMIVTNNATDSDLPAQPLSYQLINPPTNATINTNGVITWKPSDAQAPSTNQIITVVNDSLASATNSFQVIVAKVSVPILNSTLTPLGGIQFQLDVPASLDYSVESSTNLTSWQTIFNGVGQAGIESYSGNLSAGQRYYRIRF